MSKVYLAGPIAGQNYAGATAWRQAAITMLAEHGIEGISPMRGKEFLRSEEQIGLEYEHICSTAQAIVSRDRFDVQRCDVMLAFLKPADKVSVGTMIEFGWADAYRKPVVLVLDERGLHDHPFVRQIAAFHVSTLPEAVNVCALILKNVYKETPNV